MGNENVKPLVSGNWKMNGLKSSVEEIEKLANLLNEASDNPSCEVMICPPATILALSGKTISDSGADIQLGAQNCHDQKSGACTGDISAEMYKELGAKAVIVGHSERRDKNTYAEYNVAVRKKAEAAQNEGLCAIICIGETIDEKKANQTIAVVTEQLLGSLPKNSDCINTVIAYEPVWAIGSGLTPTVDDIEEIHAIIRNLLKKNVGDEEGSKIRILYGGSVKPNNAKELMSIDNVNGALVGGASLKADDFWGIISAYI